MFDRIASDTDIINDLHADGAARRKAEDALFTRFVYFIQEGIKKYSISEDESFDAYSDTILQAIRSVVEGTFRGEAALKTYLHSIFHNKCVDKIRKKTSNKNKVHQTVEISDVLHALSDPAKSAVEELMAKYDMDELRLRLDQLGEKCSKLLLLSREGYSSQEIREALGFKSADVVKTSRLRCLEKLRQLYKGVK